MLNKAIWFVACAFLFDAAAAAQEVDADTAGAAKPGKVEPAEKKATGALEGGVDVAAGYDDNLFATRHRKVDDAFVLIEPSLKYRLTTGDLQLALRGSGDVAFHDRNASEDYDDWLIGADGQVALGKSARLIAGGTYEWQHESRTSPEDVAGSAPTRFERAYAYAGLIGRAGKAAYRIGATYNDYDFADTPAASGTIANDDRDRRTFELGGRLGFEAAEGTELFVQGLWDQRRYRREIDDWGFARDSRGYSLAAGVRHEIGRSFSGEAFVGILRQDYDDAFLPDVHTIDYGMALDWTVRNGLSLSFDLDRSIEETTLPLASSYVLTSGSLSVQASAGRRIAIGGGISGADYAYRGADRSEFVIGANVWARHWLGRHLYIGADYEFGQRSSNVAGYDYDQNRVFLRLGAQLQPPYDRGASGVEVAPGSRGPDGPYLAVLLGHGSLVTGLNGPRGTGTNTADFGDVDADIGVSLGYGKTFGRLYAGVEAEGFEGGADWLHDADRRFSVSRTNSYGASLRLGRLTGQGELVYGRVGVVSTRFRTLYRRFDQEVDDARRLAGLGLGLGLEASAGSHGFVRSEYGLVSYPDYDVGVGGGGGPAKADGSVADNFSNTENRFRMGVGLRFGGNPARKDTHTDFSGAYLGVALGHGGLTSSNQGPRSGGFMLDVTRSGQGALIAAFAGAGAELTGFYLGGEIHADTGKLDWNIERDPQGRIYSVEHDYSYGGSVIAGRKISGSALLYARIGVVRTMFDTRYATTKQSVRERHVEQAPRYGAGLQIALSKKSRFRVEYNFADYAKYKIAYGENEDAFENYENFINIGFLRNF
ncbi:outer membrane beta-barrel protein [Croceicoccus ponticola]|uniref:outer membrane beta-barrel protein n=1 Tax=Croceicoccus ponticola TaxID=2217664 RepID=UPI0013E38939|nr:outer membrane beta-barrel protein [Croceicoccus ponticola]